MNKKEDKEEKIRDAYFQGKTDRAKGMTHKEGVSRYRTDYEQTAYTRGYMTPQPKDN